MENGNADSSRTVRTAVVGVGALGQIHARIYAQLAATELVGVYDVDGARAREVASKYGTRAFASLPELAEEAEAASVVVPTDQHVSVASLLLAQGLHLLVEKPLTDNTDDAQHLLELSEKHNVILQVGHVERFNPAFNYLERIATTPRFIESHRLAPYPPSRPGLPPRGTEVSVVLDLMIHDLEIVLHLVRSPVEEIRAVGLAVLSPTEDIASVRLAFANGCVANVTCSRVTPEPMRKIRVFLEDAYVSLDYRNQSGEIYRRIGDSVEKESVPIVKGEPLANELLSFAECVARRKKPLVTGEHAANALKLAVAILHEIRDLRS